MPSIRVASSSQNFDRLKPVPSDKPTGANTALENVNQARVDNIRVAPATHTAGAGNQVRNGVNDLADAEHAVTGSLTTDPSMQPLQAGSTTTATDYDERQSAHEIGSDDASSGASAGRAPAIDDNENSSISILQENEIRQPPKYIGSDLNGSVHHVEQTATEPTDEIVSDPNIASASQTSVDSAGNDQPLPSTQNSGAKAQPATAASPALVAIASRPADEHDLLVRRFETARGDEERRISVVAIRADQIALARMTERKNPQWAAIDEQFRLQQRLAAMKRGGIGV